MDTRRSFSTSTLTMKDSRSRPRSGQDVRKTPQTVLPRAAGPDRPPMTSWASRRRSSEIFRRQSITHHNGFSTIGEFTRWGFTRKILSLLPSFGYSICSVFAAMNCIRNVRLLHVDLKLSSIPLLLSGILGVCFIIACRKFSRRRLTNSYKASIALVCFNVYLILGMCLVLVSNMYTYTNVRNAESARNGTHQENVTTIRGLVSPEPVFDTQNGSYGSEALSNVQSAIKSQSRSERSNTFSSTLTTPFSVGFRITPTPVKARMNETVHSTLPMRDSKQPNFNSPGISAIITSELNKGSKIDDDSSTPPTKYAELRVLVQQDSASKNSAPVENGAFLNSSSRQYDAPTWVKVLACLGYTVLGSSFFSDYYILLCMTGLSAQPEELHAALRMVLVIGAVGAAAFGFVGALDLSHLWSSGPTSSTADVFMQWSVMSSVAILILVITTCIGMLARHSEDIHRKLKTIKKIPSESMFPRDRRPTRTAQEIFDEAAPLLGHRPVRRGSSSGSRLHTSSSSPALIRRGLSTDGLDGLDESYLSPHSSTISSVSESGAAFQDSIVAAPVARPDVIRHYPQHQVLPLVSSNKLSRGKVLMVLKRRRGLFFCMACVFLVSSTGTSLMFNMDFFSDLLQARKQSDGKDVGSESSLRDTQVTGAAMFVLHLGFVASSFAFDRLLPKIGWKRICLSLCVMVAIFSYPLASAASPILFFILVFVHGVLRVVAMSMPQLITSQTLRSQIGFQTTTIRPSLLDIPTTVLWCMDPLCLSLCAAVISPCISATGDVTLWVYYSACTATLAALALIPMMK